MIGLDEAIELALAEVRRHFWKTTWGDLMIDESGIYENDEVFAFDYGAREALVDNDRSYELVGYPGVVVRKSDGTASLHPTGPAPLSNFSEMFPNLRRIESPHRHD